jgi:hypothetical protein
MTVGHRTRLWLRQPPRSLLRQYLGGHGQLGSSLLFGVLSVLGLSLTKKYTGYVLYTGLPHQFGASLEDARSLNGSSVLHFSNCHVQLFLDPILSSSPPRRVEVREGGDLNGTLLPRNVWEQTRTLQYNTT